MFKKIIKLNLLLLFFGTFSIAEIISNIDVNGNKRLSNESIIVFTKVELNNDYSTNELNIIIKDLYETNFFKKINLRIENNTLIIDVLENPIIENIEIIGINNKGLLEVINKNLVLKNRNSYIESLFLSDLNFLKSFLKNNGFYFSEIKSSYLLNEDQNTIQLIYNINLGERFYSVKEPKIKLNWVLKKETKTLLNYKCNSASLKFKDKEYTAYYTTKIPINEGPWKYRGLPGLILEIKSLDNKIDFKVSSIKQEKHFNRIL